MQNKEISHEDKLAESRMLIDDLGLKAAEEGSLDAGVFSGEEELFAFDRTVSRLTGDSSENSKTTFNKYQYLLEMQTKDYWKKWKSYVENR